MDANVKRFGYSGSLLAVVEDDNGYYVKYADYDALRTELEETQFKLDATNGELKMLRNAHENADKWWEEYTEGRQR